MKFSFSKLAEASLVPSAVNRLTAGFAEDFREGIDINLGVGYVNDHTIPVEAIQKAIHDIVHDPLKYRNPFNYGGAEGSPNLRRAIRNYYLQNGIGYLNENDFDQRKILIGANGATSILDAMADIFKPGLVITADPFYYIYTETLQRKGFSICAIPEDEEGLNTSLLEETLNEIDPGSVSFFYIVTVNNPSTIVLSDNRRKTIVDLAARLSEKAGRIVPVFFDKAYEDIIHNPEIKKPVSGLKFGDVNHVFEIGTLSKLFAPALRVGYLIGPDNDFAKILSQRTSDIGFSAPLINQEIAACLLQQYALTQQEKVNKGYQEKSQFIQQCFREKLGDYLETWSGGDAAFYFYLTFKTIKTDQDSAFFKYLTRSTGDPFIDGAEAKKPRLVYIPGTICSKTEKAAYQLRLSYGFEAPETFERALTMMAEACSYALKTIDHEHHPF